MNCRAKSRNAAAGETRPPFCAGPFRGREVFGDAPDAPARPLRAVSSSTVPATHQPAKPKALVVVAPANKPKKKEAVVKPARREFSSQSGASTSISITLSAAIMSVTVGATDNTTVTETTVAAASVCQVPADFLVAGPVMTVTDAPAFAPDRSREESVKHFRTLISDETGFMTEMANKWDRILQEATETGLGDAALQTINDDGIDLIRLAVGQSRLFMTKKLQQFVSLVDNCEFGTGDREILPTDLAGFWDMIAMQVNNIRQRFAAVETLAANNWVAPEAEPSASSTSVDGKKSVSSKRALKPINANPKPVIQGKSNIREAIDAKRRAAQQAATATQATADGEADAPSREV